MKRHANAFLFFFFDTQPHAQDTRNINTCIMVVGGLKEEAVMLLEISLEDEAAQMQMLRLTC